MNTYLLEVGVLLTEADDEFESYSSVYNKEYGFYDEDQHYIRKKCKAITEAKEYVNKGVNNSYAILSRSIVPDRYGSGPVLKESYSIDDVIYSVAKLNDEIVENFLK